LLTLALDTSRPQGSVAISNDNEIIASLESDVTTKHMAKLLPMVDKAVKSAGVKIEDIDLFITTEGPGSFTGLRIGISAIKAFAFKDLKPIVGISSLEAMSCTLRGEGLVASTYDALRGNIFYALFDMRGNYPIRLSEDKLVSKEDFSENVLDVSPEIFVIGDGIDVIKKDLMDKKINFDHQISRPLAKDFCSFGIKMFGNKNYMRDLFTFEPKYLQESSAIRVRQTKSCNREG
jgi:tRNA threonylcarbamoyladenosine biosynthesis protein TsaB